METPTQTDHQGQMAQRGASLQGSVEAAAPHTHQTAARQSQNYPVPGDGQALLRLCPWLSTVPHRLIERLIWTEQSINSLQGKDILLLYTGPSDGGALDDVITSQQPDLGPRILAVDILRPRDSGPNDILDDGFYSQLCCAAAGGNLSFVGGGPNCRTWSILRWFPKPGAPRPVRGREPSQTWGLESNSREEQLDTDKDSLLLLRQMVITALASEVRSSQDFHSFLEHPRDPAECSQAPAAAKCSSIWTTHIYKEWAKVVGHHTVHLDQCRLGQVARKSTTFSTDPPLHHWGDLQCIHADHIRPPDMTSSDLSRYPPDLMSGLAQAIVQSTPTRQSSPMGCQQRGEPPGRTDRSSSVPLSQTMTLADDPIIVQVGFKTRPLRDGGGKPSAGRRPPPFRPHSKLKSIGDAIAPLAQSCAQEVQKSINRGDRKHPFSEELLRETRQITAQQIGLDPQIAEEIPQGQPFFLNLISALAEAGGDPDSAYPRDIATGVPLGVTSPTWTSPGIWPTTEELRGESPMWEDLLLPLGRDNYPSAKDFSTQVRQTFVEEVAMDMVEGPLTQEEAAVRCSCAPEELCPGPLAAIDEGDKIRTIYDGSWGHANSHIQQNTVEKTTAPTVMDCIQAIHWLSTHKETTSRTVASCTDLAWNPPHPHTTWAILKADVSKAHRRIKVHPGDWRYQIAQLDGEWWINKVGTYGMASAQLYWGRMAALLLRLCYLMFPHIDWGFVFVDDFCWLLRTDTATEDTGKLMLFLAALGCPLSWHKTVLSEVNTWLGFQVNPRGPIVDFPSDKRQTLEALLQSIASGSTFTAKEIERALGRLNWATAAWPLSRPFLQPFWAWKAATTSSGKPGKLIRTFALLLLQLLRNPQLQPCPYDPASNWWGASDASAHPTEGAYIGGWIADCENPTKDQTWWFHYKIPLEDNPWAHKEGDPTRRISTLEMFGTLILTHFLLQLGGKSLLRSRLSLISDNQGNIFALLNKKTKRFPTSAFLMQLIVMIHAAGVQIAPSHMKRDYNQWADELTHPDFTGFRPDRELPVREAFSHFNFLWALLADQTDAHIVSKNSKRRKTDDDAT